MTKKTYFPGLNALRLIAALSVVIGHAVDSVAPYHPSSASKFVLDFFIMTGYDAVSLFFVLSGFLITYLLLAEKQHTNDISVKNFLIRRGLRIWPVYFLVIAVTLITLPPNPLPSSTTFIGLLMFSPHLVDLTANLGHLWSIGVEEWFYFAWPFLMKRFKLIHLIIAIILIRLLIITIWFPELLIYGDRYGSALHMFLHHTRFEAIAFGALGAYLLFYRHWALRIIYRLQLLFAGFFIFIIVLPVEGGILFDLVFDFMFMGLILNLATNPKSLLKLENRVFKDLGQVTYGIYMYQWLTIQAADILVAWLGLRGFGADILFYTAVVTLTIMVALVSYQYFELPFLRLKPSRVSASEPVAKAI